MVNLKEYKYKQIDEYLPIKQAKQIHSYLITSKKERIEPLHLMQYFPSILFEWLVALCSGSLHKTHQVPLEEGDNAYYKN